MEYIVKELLHPEEDDEARYVYSELDSERKETRRVEFYPGGVCFAYGGGTTRFLIRRRFRRSCGR